MSNKLKEITDDNFQQEVVENEKVVVIDYYATWCVPCKMMGMIMKELNEEYGNTVKIVKGDIEQNSIACSKYNIKNVPSVLIFKGGELIKKMAGLRAKDDIQTDIDEVLNA
jgi:thioredoxin 1